MPVKRLVVGITGASGVIYGVRLLERIREGGSGVETLLVISPDAERNLEIETDYSIEQVKNLANCVYDHADLAAPISSGSFLTMGMVVIPCSMRSLSDIATSRGGNLLARSADVTLKEGRKLVVVPRETPLHKGHLELLLKVADTGGVILPPFPAFYHHPETIDDIIDHTVGKVLDQFGIYNNLYQRWNGC